MTSTKYLLIYLFSYFNVLSFNAQNTIIANLPSGVYSDVSYSMIQKNNMEFQSSQFTGLSKVSFINNTAPFANFSSTDFWPIGSWGRGYNSLQTDSAFYSPILD